MNILVSSGTGTGPTKLSAFDAALNNAGVANYNLLRLSSVIPSKSNILVYEGSISKNEISGKWGDRLFLVMAEKRVDKPNTQAWAGIGWVQDKKTGKGLFVEHEGTNEKSVKIDIKKSLQALMITRKVNFGAINMKTVGLTCEKDPVCALVVAVYKTTKW